MLRLLRKIRSWLPGMLPKDISPEKGLEAELTSRPPTLSDFRKANERVTIEEEDA